MNLKILKNSVIVFCIVLFCSSCTVVHESCSFIMASPEKAITEKQLSDFGIQHGKIQIGLLNYNRNSYIPWLPLVNWNMGREGQ